MEMCSGGRGSEAHDEIVFEGRDCPLCSVMSELKDAQAEIERLNNQEA